jgi:hypothetical protein
MISMAAGVSVAFPALWLASYAWNTRAAGGPLKPQHGRSWTVRPAAVPALSNHEAESTHVLPLKQGACGPTVLLPSATGTTPMHAPPATASVVPCGCNNQRLGQHAHGDSASRSNVPQEDERVLLLFVWLCVSAAEATMANTGQHKAPAGICASRRPC